MAAILPQLPTVEHAAGAGPRPWTDSGLRRDVYLDAWYLRARS